MFNTGDRVRIAHTDRFEDIWVVTDTMVDWARSQCTLEVVWADSIAVSVKGPHSRYGGRSVFSIEPHNLVLVEEMQPTKVSLRDLICEAKKRIREGYSSSSRNAVFSVIRKGSEYPHIQAGPCHGDLRNRGKGASAIVTLIVREGAVGYSGTHRQPPYEELLSYYDWLFNRSPYADCFMYKSAKNALREKCAVLRTDQPANVLQGALIATRNTWEFAPNIRIWYQLVQEGVNENLSFILCYCVSNNEGKLSASGVSRDHISIRTDIMKMEGARAFVEGNALLKNVPYNEGGTYGGVTAAFMGEGGKFFFNFKELFNSFGTKSSGANPFIKAKSDEDNRRIMGMKEFLKFVKTNEDKFIKEV